MGGKCKETFINYLLMWKHNYETKMWLTWRPGVLYRMQPTGSRTCWLPLQQLQPGWTTHGYETLAVLVLLMLPEKYKFYENKEKLENIHFINAVSYSHLSMPCFIMESPFKGKDTYHKFGLVCVQWSINGELLHELQNRWKVSSEHITATASQGCQCLTYQLASTYYKTQCTHK